MGAPVCAVGGPTGTLPTPSLRSHPRRPGSCPRVAHFMHRAGTQWGRQAAQGRARMGTPPSPQGPYVPGSPRRGWEWEATGLQHSCQPPLWDTRAHKDPMDSTYRWRVVGFSGSFGAQTQTPGLGGSTAGSIPGSSTSLLASGKSLPLCASFLICGWLHLCPHVTGSVVFPGYVASAGPVMLKRTNKNESINWSRAACRAPAQRQAHPEHPTGWGPACSCSHLRKQAGSRGAFPAQGSHSSAGAEAGL